MALQLRCPKCRKAFPWKSEEGFPEQCKLCGEFIGMDPDRDVTVIPMPFLSTAKGRGPDQLYRSMERGSERRAELAAQAVGCPVSEMSAMKMTDMNDHQREGDIAAKLVTPAGDEGKFFQANGAEAATGVSDGSITVNGQVTRGIEPRAGMRAMSAIQSVMGRTV